MIEVKDIKMGRAFTQVEHHFTGGIRGTIADSGWALHPVSEDPDSNVLLFPDSANYFKFATEECGLLMIGTCTHHTDEANKPLMDVWYTGMYSKNAGLIAADSWQAISHQANLAGDVEYSNSASYLSSCLKGAGFRLRDVSNKYHSQLCEALDEKKTSGTFFSNAALLELYNDFHSLVSELSSARDHLARIAAIHAGAPPNIDSLARLETWVGKAVNQAQSQQPLVASLLTAVGTKDNPQWLRELGEIRNKMLHREPMGANKLVSGLTLEDVKTSYGIIKTIRLAEPISNIILANQGPDPFVEISQLSINLERLCKSVVNIAKYPAIPPLFQRSLSN